MAKVICAKTLAEIRIITGAMANGIARAALDAAVRYAAERKQFGKAINRYQAIQVKLAEMATELEAAIHLVYHALGCGTTTSPTINTRPWRSYSRARLRRASATKRRGSLPPTAMRWSILRNAFCATFASRSSVAGRVKF